MPVSAIQRLIREHLQDHPILIWYDEGGTLADVFPEAVPQGVRFPLWEGSYLALRATVEREDPDFRQKWCLYVPKRAEEPSWLRDYELFGSRVDLTLERLLATEMGLRSNATMRELLAGQRGRALAANWETAMGDVRPPIRQKQVVQGLLSVAFSLGPGFSIDQAILEYVSDPELYGQRLDRLGLSRAFADRVWSEMGLDLPTDEPLATAERLAAGLLFSELTVRSSGLGAQEFQALLPSTRKRPLWAKLTDRWRENRRLQKSFLKWSQALESKYAVRDKLAGLEPLADVMSFRAVDEVLLDEVCARIEAGGPQALVEQGAVIEALAEKRGRAIWAEAGQATAWQAVASATRLIRRCREATSQLDGMTSAPVTEHLAAYTADTGWWQLDALYRELAGAVKRVDDRITCLFVEPATAAYGEWLRKLGVRFAESVSREGRWPPVGVSGQSEFWERLVGQLDEPVAVLLIDALRYDLAVDLAGRLNRQGYHVRSEPMLTDLPSITEIGMAALLPRGSTALHVAVEDSQLRVSLGERVPMNNRAGRIKWLQRVLGADVAVFDLAELLCQSQEVLQTTIAEKKWFVITGREIDRQGTFLPDVTLTRFDELVGRVADGVNKLHQAGIRRVVIGADHGFLLLPRGISPDLIDGPPAAPDVIRHRRYVIGKPAAVPGLLSFPLEALGLQGDGRAAFPRGLTCLRVQGELGSFLHGGLTLQETAVAALVSESAQRAPAQRVRIRARLPDRITNAVFLVDIEPEGPVSLFDVSRSVKVQVYSAGALIAESEPMTVHGGPIKARVVLRQIPRQVELIVVDTDTEEHLARREAVVELAGYDDLL
jgi:hypothetical protein